MRRLLKDFPTHPLLLFVTAMDRGVVIAIQSPRHAASPRVRVVVCP